MTDISALSIQELKDLQVQAEELINQKKEQAIEDAYNQVNEIAEGVGLTINQLLEIGSQKFKKPRKIVEPRYRNKKNAAETWTGRGKQPRWLVAEIEKGAKLEDFLIK
ncbi:TPA: H-NS histone family protein [Acinetobacter baumannii]|uniref:H-NS histone family protein n=1 Tax=Acinetobacter calcoaceticus/baumannii complex TaxID=909768 RepID=UPI00034BA7FF|nr:MULTISPECIES: H-NS histone family protein [Acinetobacter calcoaceticus/baumannii complex]MBZ0355227.1 H-NS histone family protein [Acinetobacter baumannii]MDQ9038447.1 H-NS histone family protein [Acinetobacter seifertii]MDR5636963.1 H-NS histone family protein [Acinetobacter baumannii]MDR8256532.1 H-NS histone family protein [Acinetobacter baumannii]MDT1826806.1 H-NS histone family protein [Acinetobacter baumannii]